MTKKMFKIFLSILIASVLIVPAVSAKTYKIGHILPESLPCGKAAIEFATIVEEQTKGEIKLRNYFTQLGPWQEQFEMVVNGTLDMGFLATSPRYESLLPLSAIWFVNGWDQFKKLYFEGGAFYNYTAESMDKLGLKLLSPFCIGFEGVGGMKGPIVYPEDLKKQKLKVRTMGGLSTLFWEDLAPVVKVDMAEVFTALQLGTVDVQADQAALMNYGSFKEVTKYFTDLNTFPAFGTFFINKELWEKFSPENQKIIFDAATKVCQECTEASRQQEEAIYDLFEKEGTVITRLTPEQREKWMEEALKKGGYFDKLKEKIGDEMVDFMLKASSSATDQ